MAPGTMSFNLVLIRSQESYLCWLLTRGTGVFFFFLERGFQVKKMHTINRIKTLTLVSIGTKVLSRESFLDKLSEKFDLNGFWEGNTVFARGTMCPPPPPLVFGSQKNLVGIGLMLNLGYWGQRERMIHRCDGKHGEHPKNCARGGIERGESWKPTVPNP